MFVFSSHLPLNFSYSVDTTFLLSLRGGVISFHVLLDLFGGIFSNSGTRCWLQVAGEQQVDAWWSWCRWKNQRMILANLESQLKETHGA